MGGLGGVGTLGVKAALVGRDRRGRRGIRVKKNMVLRWEGRGRGVRDWKSEEKKGLARVGEKFYTISYTVMLVPWRK